MHKPMFTNITLKNMKYPTYHKSTRNPKNIGKTIGPKPYTLNYVGRAQDSSLGFTGKGPPSYKLA